MKTEWLKRITKMRTARLNYNINTRSSGYNKHYILAHLKNEHHWDNVGNDVGTVTNIHLDEPGVDDIAF